MGVSGIIREPRPNDDKRKFQCLFCDEEISLEYYRSFATPDEIYHLLAEWKICTKHARELDEAQQTYERREIERTVA